MDSLTRYGPLLGRLLIATIFVVSGLSKFADPAGNIVYARSMGLPFPEVAVWAAAMVEVVGGLLIAFGLRTREAAISLFLYLIPVTAVFHRPVDEMQFIQMLKNLAIMGGLITLAAHGPGPVSVDERRRQGIRIVWQPRVRDRVRR